MILASGSPQRRAILEQLGIDFQVVVSGVDELDVGPPEEVATENARRKAAAAAAGSAAEAGGANRFGAETPILGVDTLVTLDGHIYGKPRDRTEALATLSTLAGRSHRVISGVCLIHEGGLRTASAITEVTFRPLDQAAVSWYVDTGEWRGRAGGYAIQARGAALVESISGDYLNVVGLPVATMIDLLPSLFFQGFSGHKG